MGSPHTRSGGSFKRWRTLTGKDATRAVSLLVLGMQRLVESERCRRACDLRFIRLRVDEDVDRIADRVHRGEYERGHHEKNERALPEPAEDVADQELVTWNSRFESEVRDSPRTEERCVPLTVNSPRV